MIALVKITQVIGQFKRFGSGPGVLMRGVLDGETQIPVHGFIKGFPLGLISSFLIDREVSCVLIGHGKRMRAEILPFENQPGSVVGHVISLLVRMANEAGTGELEKLPMLSLKQSNVLPPLPQPEAERLEQLLALDAEPPDPFPADPFPDEDDPF